MHEEEDVTFLELESLVMDVVALCILFLRI